MKKVLSLLMALALVLTMGLQSLSAPVFAWGLFEGDQDGNMHLEKNITRAEIAVLITRLKNAGEEAKALASQTIPVSDFEDIPVWARGFVNYVYKQGILKGSDKNQFMPNQNITQEELAVIMIRLEKSPVQAWNENHKYFAGTKAEIKAGTLTRGDVKKSLEGWLGSKIQADTKGRGKFVYKVLGRKKPEASKTTKTTKKAPTEKVSDRQRMKGFKILFEELSDDVVVTPEAEQEATTLMATRASTKAAAEAEGETLAEQYSADRLGTEYKKNREGFKFPHKILMLQAGKDKGIDKGSFAKIRPDGNFFRGVADKMYEKHAGGKYSLTLPLEQTLIGGLTKTIRVLGNGLTKEGQQQTLRNDSKMNTFRVDTGFPFVVFSEKPLDDQRLAEIVGDMENTKPLKYKTHRENRFAVTNGKPYHISDYIYGYNEYIEDVPMDPAKYAGMPNLMGVTNGYRKFEDGSKDNINVFPLAVTILNNVEYTELTDKDYTIKFDFDEDNYIQVPYNRPYVYLFGVRLDVVPKEEVARLQKIADNTDWNKPVEFKGIVARELQLPRHDRFIMQSKVSKVQQDFLREQVNIIDPIEGNFGYFRIPYSPTRFIIIDENVQQTSVELEQYETREGGLARMRLNQDKMDAIIPTFTLLGQRPTDEPFMYIAAWSGDGKGYTYRTQWLGSEQIGFTSPLVAIGRHSPYITTLMSREDLRWYAKHDWRFPPHRPHLAKNAGTDFLYNTLLKYTEYVTEDTKTAAGALNPVLISFEATTGRMNGVKDKLSNINNPIGFTMLHAAEGLIIRAVE